VRNENRALQNFNLKKILALPFFSNQPFLLTLYTFIILSIAGVFSCSKKDSENSIANTEEKDTIAYSGENLAKIHCASCHVYTEPELLTKDIWKNSVLPQMAHRMGIYEDTVRESLIESGSGGRLVEQRGIFPTKSIISEEKWEKIKSYYLEKAPDSLILPEKEIQMGINGLKVELPEFRISPPMITAIKYHTELKQIFVADAKTDFSTINILDNQLNSVSTLALPSPISHIDFQSDTILATLMGGFMPTDSPGGSVVRIFKRPGENEYKGFTTILKDLQRPVHTTYADINGDRLEDIIVCEYGNHTGKLSLFINRMNGQYERKILSADPGATTVTIRDLNGDGLPDIIALMAQGNERIDVYYNQGQGDFKIQNLLKFPPSYGSVFMTLMDWDHDGFEDIIYVNGDNADYSMILKPYHGIRIFINDGKNNFHEVFFQQINGAYQATAHDFDRDGDMDIATISFFPDLIHNPEEGFVLMENISTKDTILFNLDSFDQVTSGRWLTMDTADLNNDHFPELILGAFTGMPVQGDVDGKFGTRLIESSPTLMVLQFDSKLVLKDEN